MFTRRYWLWLFPTWKSTVNTSLSGGCLAAPPNNCACWLHGCSSKKSRKRAWHQRSNIGNQGGGRGKATGSGYARSEKVHAGRREGCIWRKRYPIADDGDAGRISEMPSA